MKILLYTTFLLFFSASSTDAEEWMLKKAKDNIEIYTRAVPNSPFREFKATSIIDTSFEKLLQELYDAPTYTPMCEEGISYRIPDSSHNSRLFYYKQKMPWPIRDRDVITKLTLKEQTDNHILLTIEVAPDIIAPQNKTLRIKELSGSWLLERDVNGIKATQQIHMNPGGNVPSSITNLLLVKGPYKTFTELHRKLSTYDSYAEN